MYHYANKLIGWGEEKRARHLTEQLRDINAVLARGVEYELLWCLGDYEKAQEMYAQHEQWPDRTRYQQVLALIEGGRIQEAQTTVSQIQDADVRLGTQARMLFELQDWQRLAAITPTNNEQRKWQLLALARQNLKSAGEQMDRIKDNVEMQLPQLKLLVKYYASINDDRNLVKYAKQLAQNIDSESERLAKLTDAAITDKSSLRAKRLLGKLAAINPEADNIQEYKQQISELNAKMQPQS